MTEDSKNDVLGLPADVEKALRDLLLDPPSAAEVALAKERALAALDEQFPAEVLNARFPGKASGFSVGRLLIGGTGLVVCGLVALFLRGLDETRTNDEGSAPPSSALALDAGAHPTGRYEAVDAGTREIDAGVAAAVEDAGAEQSPLRGSEARRSVPLRPKSPPDRAVLKSSPRDAGIATPPADVEFALMSDARRAVQDGHLDAAFALLREHEDRFPDGSMAEERELWWIVALVDADRRAEAELRCDRFLERWPRSIHRTRVLRTLGRDD